MHLGPVRREHAPLCCPFTPQIWAAQLLLNVYSSGNWLHPVKVQVTSHPKPPPAPSSAAAPLLFHHFSHLPFPHSAFQTWIASAISLRFGSEVGQTIKAPPPRTLLQFDLKCLCELVLYVRGVFTIKKGYKKPLAVFTVTLSSVVFAPPFFPSESRLQCFLSSQQLDALFDTDEAVKSSQNCCAVYLITMVYLFLRYSRCTEPSERWKNVFQSGNSECHFYWVSKSQFLSLALVFKQYPLVQLP